MGCIQRIELLQNAFLVDTHWRVLNSPTHMPHGLSHQHDSADVHILTRTTDSRSQEGNCAAGLAHLLQMMLI